MPKITAWQCPRTQKLFATKHKYRTHLIALAKANRERKRVAALKAAAQTTLGEIRTLPTFFAIERWLVENIERLFYAQKALGYTSRFHIDRMERFKIEDLITRVELSDMRWDYNCSISHCAPLGMQTNWGGEKKNYPRSMPGYRGRIRLFYGTNSSYGSDLLSGTGINTGSGGGGGGSVGYDVTLFAKDFPMLVMLDQDHWVGPHRDQIGGTRITEGSVPA